MTPEGWQVTPAGRQSALGPAPLAVATTPDGSLVLVADAGFDHHALLVLDAKSGALRQEFAGAADGSSGYYVGLAVSRDGKHVYASDGAGSAVHTFTINGAQLKEGPSFALPRGVWPAGIAVSASGQRVFVVGNLSDTLMTLDAGTGAIVGTAPTGHLPYGVALARDGAQAFVSNWGESSVTVLDVEKSRATTTLQVGTHPSAISSSPSRNEIYVANSDSDDVSVIDAGVRRVRRRIDLQAFAGAPVGVSPNALSVSPDGSTLYVANAGFNDVAVVQLSDGQRRPDRVSGLIPTGWYPSALALDPSGRTLFVTNMKGNGIGPVARDQYIADLLRGTLSRIEVPDSGTLAAYTTQVWKNVKLPERATPSAASVIPNDVGDSSPLEHVIYVLKENRTFDQVLGDLGRGNGDPTLTIFGEDVTPNHHALARQFATFDNFYCDGEVSADGWTWSNAANANTYNQKNWPLDYGASGRQYDFGGFGDSSTAAFPGRVTLKSFLWDRLADKGVSYRNYGFFVNGAPVSIDSSMPGLIGHTDLAYPGWNLAVQDQARIDEWLKEFRGFVVSGRMPSVQFVYLPNDHTDGTTPGSPSPAAMVADNDLALGRLVEAVSRSRFWKNTVIFVTEDDAQDGPDHVDGHRSLAFAISPYTQTGKVDSTFYSTVSILRSIELIVGVGPMTQFDALATPMRADFMPRPNLRSYRTRVPTQSLTEINAADAPLARASLGLDFSKPDSAKASVLTQAIWQSRRGRGNHPPATRSGVRQPLDDD